MNLFFNMRKFLSVQWTLLCYIFCVLYTYSQAMLCLYTNDTKKWTFIMARSCQIEFHNLICYFKNIFLTLQSSLEYNVHPACWLHHTPFTLHANQRHCIIVVPFKPLILKMKLVIKSIIFSNHLPPLVKTFPKLQICGISSNTKTVVAKWCWKTQHLLHCRTCANSLSYKAILEEFWRCTQYILHIHIKKRHLRESVL